MRKVVLALLAFCALMFTMPMAYADISGVPNLPSYPCIGPAGLAAVVPYQYFDCPTEANGVHYHCEIGGPNISGGAFTGSNGIGIGGLGNFGFVFGSCAWRWPDNTDGPAPNPPGAWRNFLVPSPIPANHTAPPRPYDQTIDVAPKPIPVPAPPEDCPDCKTEAAPQPQVIPPPTVAPPTLTAPITPDQPEVLAPAPEKQGDPVKPGEGVVPPTNLSPKDLNPTAPDRDSLRPRGN